MPDVEKPNYGIDAPGVVAIFLILGPALLSARMVRSLAGDWSDPVRTSSHGRVRWAGVLSGRRAHGLRVRRGGGKFTHRDRMLQMISWRGDETVLDVTPDAVC